MQSIDAFYEPACIALNSDGSRLAAAGPDGVIEIWDLAAAKRIGSLAGQTDETFSSLAFSPDGTLLASGSFSGTVKLWNIATGQTQAVLDGKASPGYLGRMPVACVSFSPDGKLLASAGGAGLGDNEWEEPPDSQFELTLWDVESGREKTTIWGQTGQMFSATFSPDGKLLATCDCRDFAFRDGVGSVRFWDVQSMLKARE